MKKILLFTFILFLAACSKEAAVTTLEDPSPDQQLSSSEAGLSLTLSEDLYTGSPKVIETAIKNESQRNFGFGEYYYIEVENNGEWYIVTHSDAVFLKNPHLIDYGYLLKAGSQMQQTFSLDLLGITLPPGEYRLVKTFLSQDEPFYEVSLSSPFTVE